jgi:HSP20 family molecular chaperone IbpA
MAKDKNEEMQVSQKQEVSTTAEQTRTGTVFTPAVDIFEADDAITVLADMPGVAPDSLDIDLRDSVLTLTGEVKDPENERESALLREYGVGSFYRQFKLGNAIDQEKIDAKLTDGVLRLKLPKAEASKPRRIEVKST